mgnify:CR=1 FL=1
MVSTVGPETVKEITRLSIRELGDIYWHVLAGTQTFPVQVATKLKIPLIIWGVNGWLDQVGMFSHHDQVEMTKKVLAGGAKVIQLRNKIGSTLDTIKWGTEISNLMDKARGGYFKNVPDSVHLRN